MPDPTMQTLVNDVTSELRFGTGTSVQIHLEDNIVRGISRCYRTLMKEHIWRDYYHVNDLTIDEATGQAIEPLDTILTRFSNIIAIYQDNDPHPFPVAPLITNPSVSRRPVVVHSGGTQVFTIWPKTDRNIILVSKIFQENDFTLQETVPFYRDLLVLKAAMELSVKAGINTDLTKLLGGEYDRLVKIYKMAEMQDSYALHGGYDAGVSDWWVA